MDDSPNVENQWYVTATSSSRADELGQVLKSGDTFGIFDRHGDIHLNGSAEQGLYFQGTRYLSKWELRINGQRPMLLNAIIKEDNSLLTVDMTLPDLRQNGTVVIPKGTVHIFRSVVLAERNRHEHLRLVNYGDHNLNLTLKVSLAADYRDIFEVRGVDRPARGNLLEPAIEENLLTLAYQGLDGETRRTRVRLDWRPDRLEVGSFTTGIELAPREARHLHVSVACSCGESDFPWDGYYQAIDRKNAKNTAFRNNTAQIVTSSEQFNLWLNRSEADLEMLTTETAFGPYPYAGVPWFSTPFGRDGLITALQILPVNPNLAKGVLAFLAATQAQREEPEADAEPGKILHETREGEMAALGEIPFQRYYGSVDSTPLFILLAGHYYRRTGDRAFIESIWTSIEQALHWIDVYGDADRDGFVEYARHSADGLIQQGWKDSHDSVFHADGSMAEPPIALCEVQGYVYEAKILAAELAVVLGRESRAHELLREAELLKQHFNEAFWLEDLGTFALALDGEKRPCRIRTSNPGHVLASGIANPAYARRTVDTLLSAESFNGWGIRTVAEGECRFNPMSYHNGSVWPHDNAMAAAGFARYGLNAESLQLLTGLFEATLSLDLNRLPELFCGFTRRPGQGPTLYPVACSPQAWASGAVFQLLQACLGLSFSPHKPQLRFDHPRLPDCLDWLRITHLRCGDGSIDLALTRHANDVGINVERKVGDIEVAVIV